MQKTILDKSVVLVAASLACVLLLMMAGSVLDDRSSGKAAYDYENRSKERISTECPDVSGIDRAKCVNEIVNAEAEIYRGYKDLQAQQEAAKWALWMVVVGIVSTAFTGAGIVLVWHTLREAVATNEAAQKSVAIALADQRPWLKLSVSILGELTINKLVVPFKPSCGAPMKLEAGC